MKEQTLFHKERDQRRTDKEHKINDCYGVKPLSLGNWVNERQVRNIKSSFREGNIY